MAKTDPDAPRHQQFSTFIVELPNPASRFCAILTPCTDTLRWGSVLVRACEIEIKNLIVPKENLLGGRGQGFNMGQHRLGYGRLRHGMHNVAKRSARSIWRRNMFWAVRLSVRNWPTPKRTIHAGRLRSEIYKARLMLMHIAYKAENGLDMSQENSIAKISWLIWCSKWSIPRCSCMARWAIRATRLWPIGTPLSAAKGWSTARTKCIAGKSEKMCCALLKKMAQRQWQRR